MKPGAKTDMVLDVGIYNGQIDDGLYRLVIDTPSPTTIEGAQGKEAYIINEPPIVFEFTVSDDGLTQKTSF